MLQTEEVKITHPAAHVCVCCSFHLTGRNKWRTERRRLLLLLLL